jgi:predicted ester cyclase
MTISLESNKELVRNLYGTLMANGDIASANSILAEDYVDHSIPGLPRKVSAAFPGIQPELYEILAEGDLVSVRVEAGGTHTGAPFNGIPTTGKAIRWKEIHIFRCQHAKIVEHWGVFDLLSILQQLGAIPS